MGQRRRRRRHLFLSLLYTRACACLYVCIYIYIYIYMRDVLRRAQNAPVSLVLSTQGALLVCKGRALIKPLSLLSLRAMMMSEAVLPTKFYPQEHAHERKEGRRL